MGEFLSLVPKHKGTDKMCSHVKRQMSQLREDIERRKKATRKTRSSYFIEKAGAAQVVILGQSNVGRSTLLKKVTNSPVEVGSWPFTTRSPMPGMMPFRDIQFQLVEAPPVIEGSSEGKADGFKVLSLARNSDGLIVMVDLTKNAVEDYITMAEELEKSRILTTRPEGEVDIKRRGHGSDIQFVWEGALEGCTVEDVTKLLKEYKIKSAILHIRGKVSLDIIEDAIFGNAVYRPSIVVANKADIASSAEVLGALSKEAWPLEVLVISAENTENLSSLLGTKLFEILDIIRVYTKEPGKEPSNEPIISRKGLTVGGLAKKIHSDFYKQLKYARIWGPSAKFDNERVGSERELSDGDVVELHL
jgi:ribosome-interacting GTPase 1